MNPFKSLARLPAELFSKSLSILSILYLEISYGIYIS